MITIQCRKCGDNLIRQRNRKDAICYACILVDIKNSYYQNRDQKIKQVREYRQNNKEIITARRKLKYLLNREKIIKKVKEYYIKNRKRILKKKEEYRINNPEKIRIKNRNRINLLRSLSKITDISNAYIKQILDEAKKCPICHKLMKDKEKHIDHILPIIMGGSHTKGNIRVICKKCNLSRPKDGRDNENSI